MKTKILLFFAVLLAVSFSSVNAQRLLISEEFSSTEWQAELLYLNPGSTDGTAATLINPNAINVVAYAPPVPGTTVNSSLGYSDLNSIDLYFNKYRLQGAIEVIRLTSAVTRSCALGGNHNTLLSDTKSMPLGFRFHTSGTSVFEMPEIPNADTIIMHLRCGNPTSTSELYIEKWENDTWTNLYTFSVQPKGNYSATSVDEIVKYKFNSRVPIKTRIRGAFNKFTNLYQVDVQEHFSAGLKHSIDSATVIKTDNADNIGTAVGQYPQAVYDDYAAAIDSATVVFEDTTTTQIEVEGAELVLNTAIADFKASMIDVGTGFNPISLATIKQYGRKLVINKPATIAIYNTVGTLVYQQNQVQILEIPASVGNGVFIVKSGPGVRKIYLGE